MGHIRQIMHVQSFVQKSTSYEEVKIFLMDYLVPQEKVMGANFSMEPLNRPAESSKLIYEIISKGRNFSKKLRHLIYQTLDSRP